MIKKMLSKLIAFLKNNKSTTEIENPHSDFLKEKLAYQLLFPIDYYEDGDIFIASYPKSGVNWLCHLTLGLMFGFDASRIPSVVVANLVPDVHWASFYQRTGRQTIFKTHLLPSPEMKKVVLLYRDGRDSLISYYHMLRNEGKEVSLLAMADGSFPIFPCGWGEFLDAWDRNPYNADILKICYEDLLNKPHEVIERYAEFCGIEVSQDQRNLVISQASFKNLQTKEIREQKEKRISWIKNGLFFRKGKAGSFHDELPENILKIYESRYREQFHSKGYKLYTA
jgi:hypothetical protein